MALIIRYPVKPLYSGHHQDLNSVRYRGVRYIEVLLKSASFTSTTYSRVLGYRVIEPKVCQKVGVGRRKSLKTIYNRICFYDNLEITGWRVFASRKKSQSTQWTRMLFLWFILILTVKKKRLSMFNRNFHYCIHISILVPLCFGHLCNWKTLQRQR